MQYEALHKYIKSYKRHYTAMDLLLDLTGYNCDVEKQKHHKICGYQPRFIGKIVEFSVR